MASKKEVMDGFINHQTYLGSEIKKKISEISVEKSYETPSTIKKGDVFVDYVGVKCRPCVVIKVKKCGMVIGLPLTSTENIHNLIPYKSRFSGEGWFCNTYTITTEEHVKSHFSGVFDNMKDLNLAIKALREFIGKNI